MDTLTTVRELVKEAFEAHAKTLGADVSMNAGTKNALNFEHALQNRTVVVDLQSLSFPWGDVSLTVNSDLPEGQLIFTEGGDD